MAVQPRDVEIRRPCPVELDPARTRSGARSWHCDHCDKAVHVLSNMTEREARALLAERDGQDLCVTYAVKKDGTIRFRAEAPAIVPVAALARRRPALAAAAIGLGVALAACAPHERERVDAPDISAIDTADTPRLPVVPIAPPLSPIMPDDVVVDGGIEAFDEIPEPGGIKAKAIPDEPCDPPKPIDKAPKRSTTIRGGLG